jgi:hypothetical protein
MSGIIVASLLSACSNGTNSNNTRSNVTNLGTNNANVGAIVTNSNSNSSNSNRWNSNISREEYEKNRTEYEKNKGSSESVGQSLEDSWLWFKTKSALMTASDLRDSTINVDVDKAVVTLKGTVANAAQKTKAEQTAKGIEGVKSVKNELKIAPNDSVTNMSGNTNKK